MLWEVIRDILSEVVEFPGGGESGKVSKSVKKLKFFDINSSNMSFLSDLKKLSSAKKLDSHLISYTFL